LSPPHPTDLALKKTFVITDENVSAAQYFCGHFSSSKELHLFEMAGFCSCHV